MARIYAMASVPSSVLGSTFGLSFEDTKIVTKDYCHISPPHDAQKHHRISCGGAARCQNAKQYGLEARMPNSVPNNMDSKAAFAKMPNIYVWHCLARVESRWTKSSHK
jgi:hypothetical protein